MKNHFMVGVVTLIILSPSAFSQLIPLKTIPLATGEQFLIFPSVNRAIGGTTLALSDSLSDPFDNPASGGLISGIQVFAAPSYYGIGLNRGRAGGSSAQTFPFGLLFRSGDVFGGMALARQTISLDEQNTPVFNTGFFNTVPQQKEMTNSYTFGILGVRIPESSFSVGVSAFWSDLNALEGVQYLYSTPNDDLWQRGSMSVYRLGLRGEWDNERVLEVLFAYQETEMKHGYSLISFPMPWDSWIVPRVVEHIEEDQSNGYAFSTNYRQAISEKFHAGAMIGFDVRSYPKIPNYELMSIPRDPGTSLAWNLGIGLVSPGPKAIGAIDVIYEPASSETWAEATAPITTPSGGRISVGGRTVENEFDFYNYIVRAGVRSAVRDIGVGVSLHRYKYYLRQINHITEQLRRQREEWSEWTFSLSFGFDLFGGHVKYLGLFTVGSGRPSVEPRRVLTTSAMDRLSTFLVAPSGPLTLNEAWTGTHQVSFVVHLD